MSHAAKAVAILPARLQSTRLPRKPLVDILGLPMIVHVLKRCQLARSLDAVFVATDSPEIAEVVTAHGGKVIMTRSDHETGSDRLAEACAHVPGEIIVNVQGDEALVKPEHIDAVVNEMKAHPEINIALLVNPFSKRNSPSDIKVVLSEANNVLYLSRTDIPSDARTAEPPLLKAYHIVPFRREFLLQYAAWPKGRLERIEFNEYLRVLEKGHTIRAVHVESSAVSVDTAEDLAYVRAAMASDPYFPTYAPGMAR